jgi:hypothetical protein
VSKSMAEKGTLYKRRTGREGLWRDGGRATLEA